jgi:GGDEF domain-containing protein
MDLQAALLGAQAELRLKAMHDSMTGLLNRGAILEVLERELARSQREQTADGFASFSNRIRIWKTPTNSSTS